MGRFAEAFQRGQAKVVEQERQETAAESLVLIVRKGLTEETAAAFVKAVEESAINDAGILKPMVVEILKGSNPAGWHEVCSRSSGSNTGALLMQVLFYAEERTGLTGCADPVAHFKRILKLREKDKVSATRKLLESMISTAKNKAHVSELGKLAAETYRRDAMFPITMLNESMTNEAEWFETVGRFFGAAEATSALRAICSTSGSEKEIWNLTLNPHGRSYRAAVEGLLKAGADPREPNDEGNCAFKLMNESQRDQEDLEWAMTRLWEAGARPEDLLVKMDPQNIVKDSLRDLMTSLMERDSMEEEVEAGKISNRSRRL